MLLPQKGLVPVATCSQLLAHYPPAETRRGRPAHRPLAMVMKKTNPWSTKRLALYSLALAFLSWGWALLPGAGTLTSACRKLPLAERRPLYSAAGIPVVSESCATTLSCE